MSFGFSVGDIILLSQLSYGIYQSVTSGRKHASRDLKELGGVLFGLKCALDHLRHSLEDVASTSNAVDPFALREVETREKLDLMLQNCADTLEDLDNATKKYRDGANDGVFTPEEKSRLSRSARLKRRLASNMMKIRWDMDKDDLRSYRDKLSSHADGINLLLSSIMWSKTHEIHTQGGFHAQQLTELHTKISTENATLAKLMGEILKAVMQNAAAAKDTPVEPDTTMEDRGVLEVKAFSKVQQNGAAINASGPGRGTAMGDDSMQDDARPHYGTTPITKPIPFRVKRQQGLAKPNLPPAIILLNAQRQENALKFIPPPLPTTPPDPPPRPSCFTIGQASILELVQGLIFLLNRDAEPNPNLEKDVMIWVRLLSNMDDFTIAKQPSDLVNMMICLNNEIDKTSDERRRVFYNASRIERIDDLLVKLVKISRSVRAEKEVEDFEDAREDFLSTEAT